MLLIGFVMYTCGREISCALYAYELFIRFVMYTCGMVVGGERLVEA